MLYTAIKNFMGNNKVNTVKAAESCGNDPISKIFIALKKKGITVKVDPKDQLHVKHGYKKEALIKRVEKLVKIDGEWENLDYIILETDEYTLKFRVTLEGWVFCNTDTNKSGEHAVHTIDDSELPKWIWDIKFIIGETLSDNINR